MSKAKIIVVQSMHVYFFVKKRWMFVNLCVKEKDESPVALKTKKAKLESRLAQLPNNQILVYFFEQNDFFNQYKERGSLKAVRRDIK